MKQRIYFTITVVCLAATFCANAQTITTVVGTGAMGHSGDGGAATAAELFYPSGIAVDGSGNLYVSDVNPYVRKIDLTGTISNFAGNGTFGYTGDGGLATAAEVGANKLATDNSGNVYIANANSVRKISTAGIITTIAGSSTAAFSGDGGPATAAMLNGVFGIAVDASGNVFVGDVNNFRVRKISTAGIISTYVGNGTSGNSGDGGMATDAQIQDPTGLAIDASGNLYIADNTSNVIRKVTPSGTISTIIGNGTAGYSGDGGAATIATLDHAASVAIDASGNLYIADLNNNVIRKVTAAGIISTYAGNGTSGFSGDGGIATAGELSQPSGVALDGSGNLYIADNQNSRVRKVTAASTGIIQTNDKQNVISISPNPSNGLFRLEVGFQEGITENAQIDIINALGQIAYRTEAAIAKGRINSDILLPTTISKGIFVLKVKCKDATTTMRLVIQ